MIVYRGYMKQTLFVISAMLCTVGIISLIGSKVPLATMSLGWMGQMAGMFLIPVSIVGMIGAYMINRRK